MGQSQSSSKVVEDKQAFVLHTKASLIEQDESGRENKEGMYAYLKGPGFKRQVGIYLNNNFVEEKKIKVIVNRIEVVPKTLTIKITGVIKVLKKESEPLFMVKDGLKTALPSFSASGEALPSRRGRYRIQFKESETRLELDATD
jgi:hypothetical protein